MRLAIKFPMIPIGSGKEMPGPSPIPVLAFLVAAAGLSMDADVGADELSPAPGQIDFFEAKIRPVLVEQCYSCHSAESKSLKGGLRLDVREGVRRGGESGPAVVPGKPDDSLLLSALRHESFQMPPERKLSDEVVENFARWVEMGAPDPRDGEVPATAEAVRDWDAARQFWSFQPPVMPALPDVSEPDWIQTRVDAFVLAGLDRAKLSPNLPADRRTLIRRVTFDLIGLPPSVEEVEAYNNDDSANAYERLVERLLASPQYGERWARLWLDVMRYGEDQAHIVGNDRSLCYPNAYRYRDWVIHALNSDLGYDEFLRRQLAADLLYPDQPEEHVALGFVGLGPKYYRRNTPEVMADEWEDRVDVLTRGVLGVTVACARCHDHKYDPFEMADYYALAGVFASTEMYNRPLNATAELDKNGQVKKPEESVHIIRDQRPHDLNIFLRGDVTKPGAIAPRRFVKVLSTHDAAPWIEGSGRVDLASALVDRRNPLTARVIVNRVWSAHFGRPLVATPSNFGLLGERPTHPELLDDLAVGLMEHGWSLKWLHRQLVLSAAYRQSSETRAEALASDPGNRWLWRMNRRRLSAEQWRDAVLDAAVRLDSSVGGPSIEPDEPQQRRRTVYSRISRLELNAMLARFDFPDPNTHSDGRAQTTTPLQKLLVLNSPFMDTQSAALAELIRESAEDDRTRLTRLYQAVYQREPRSEERELALNFLSSGPDSDANWTQLAQTLLAANEFHFLD